MAERRAQSLPLDFMVAIFLFIILLAYFMVIWQIFTDSYASHHSRSEAEFAAILLSDQLASSQGSPENWTLSPEDAKQVGFASRPGEISSYKAAAFSALPYATQKHLLGLDKDFFMKVEGLDGVLHHVAGEGTGNASRVVAVSRICKMGGQTVFLRVQVYE